MTIDATASQSQYVDHLLPVWQALPAEARGTFYACTRPVWKYALSLGIDATLGAPREPGNPLVFAGHHDMTEAHPSRRLAYLSHGTDQTYEGDPIMRRNPSYSGGRDRERVSLFLVPNEASAAKERALYGSARVEVIGCPRLDPFPPSVRPSGRLVVACAWHWDLRMCAETRWAWPDWHRRVLAELRDDPSVTLLGTGHPRAWGQLGRWYDQQGIEAVRDPNVVLQRADVVVADNTSLMWEAMACGVGVVALNARWYRRDVEHGLRFWERCPQPSLWPTEPEGALRHAVGLAAEPSLRFAQMRSVEDLYPLHTRGVAAKMAAAALVEWAQ